MRMTFLEMITRTQALMRDPYGDRFPVARVGEAVNLSVLSICDRLMCCLDTVAIRLLSGVYVYDLAAHIEARREAGDGIRSFSCVEQVVFEGTNLISGGTLVDTFVVRGGLSWSVDFVDCGKLMLVPAPGRTLPDGSAGTLDVRYVALPEPMAADGDYPDAAVPPCDDLVCLSAACLLLEEGVRDDDFAGMARLAKGREMEYRKLKARMGRLGGRVFDDMVAL